MKSSCNQLRKDILEVATEVRALLQDETLAKADPEVADEATANIMLAFRHLEDARMRLGKVIQATEGGVSIFDKPRSTIPHPHPNSP